MSQTIEVRVPDIGDFKDVPVIEVLVKSGDRVKKNDSLITLESEKASMEVPAEAEGVGARRQGEGRRQGLPGMPILTLQRRRSRCRRGAATRAGSAATHARRRKPRRSRRRLRNRRTAAGAQRSGACGTRAPPLRARARRRSCKHLRGSGPNGRITREDVQGFVKGALERGGAGAAPAFGGLPPWPKVDFAQYGPIERRPLSRIKKFSGPNLHRNWLQIPHITNYDEADVTSLEAFRNEVNAERTSEPRPKLTMLAFLVRAAVAALQRFPEFNASLDGGELVLKRYYNVGFAADTPDGLVVPVIKNADRKGLFEIAARARRSQARRARESCRWRTCRAARSRSRRSAASAARRLRRS